ncbi:hypothetical protein EGR_10201 [Echinococcus granulosus]|uniref:Uncharacterized protein n=1 Tax=Echinococcus granulosus TaxID=6210 RepID=W6U1N2_ECHGR|nr:hypothetical protein EGR_10201 [Echinococcus granulosus]EUB54943.1 hypothetical protein EGR_10201 [Echinococcus granulosus]
MLFYFSHVVESCLNLCSRYFLAVSWVLEKFGDGANVIILWSIHLDGEDIMRSPQCPVNVGRTRTFVVSLIEDGHCGGRRQCELKSSSRQTESFYLLLDVFDKAPPEENYLLGLGPLHCHHRRPSLAVLVLTDEAAPTSTGAQGVGITTNWWQREVFPYPVSCAHLPSFPHLYPISSPSVIATSSYFLSSLVSKLLQMRRQTVSDSFVAFLDTNQFAIVISFLIKLLFSTFCLDGIEWSPFLTGIGAFDGRREWREQVDSICFIACQFEGKHWSR